MKRLDSIDDSLKSWLESQPIFFVASAPLADDGHVNCSPKGVDCFRVLSSLRAAYLDFTGSGAETAAHVQENGRIVLMFCAFSGKPNIVRLHGNAEVVGLNDHRFGGLACKFAANPGVRAVILVDIDRVSSSCGYSVPLMDFRERRETLDKWADHKGPDALAEYRQQKNARSIDGLPAFGT